SRSPAVPPPADSRRGHRVGAGRGGGGDRTRDRKVHDVQPVRRPHRVRPGGRRTELGQPVPPVGAAGGARRVVRTASVGSVTPVRLAPPVRGRGRAVGRTVAGYRPSAVRSVARPMRVTPLLRPPEPPLSPSRRDVRRRGEEAEEWSCAYCDSSFGQMAVAEVDHIRPLANGGVHEWRNLAPACSECNRSKGPCDVTSWLAEIAGEGFTQQAGATT